MILFLKKNRIQFWLLFILALSMISCYASKKVELQEPPKEVITHSEEPTKNLPIARSNISKIDHTRKSNWQYTFTKVPSRNSSSTVKILTQNVWWASSGKSYYKTKDSGKTWQTLKLPLTKADKIVAMDFPSENIGWIVSLDDRGEPYEESKGKTKIFFTNDGGDTWNLQFEADALSVDEIHFVNEQEGWIFGESVVDVKTRNDRSFLLLHTKNQGKEWKDESNKLSQFNDENPYPSVVWAGTIPTKEISFIERSSGLFTLAVNEEKWQHTMNFPECLPQEIIRPFACLEDGRIWSKSGADSIEGIWGRIWLMNKDQSWEQYTINDSVYLADAILLSENEIVACGAMPRSKKQYFDVAHRIGLILHSLDGGKSWGIIFQDEKVGHIYSLTKIDEKHFMASNENGVVLQFKKEEKN